MDEFFFKASLYRKKKITLLKLNLKSDISNTQIAIL